MQNPDKPVEELHQLRTAFSPQDTTRKLVLLKQLQRMEPNSKKGVKLYYETLLFLVAYPDNAAVKKMAEQGLQSLKQNIEGHEVFQYSLFNSGMGGTYLCASFSFDVIKWLRRTYGANVTLDSFEADDSQISSIVSAMLPKVESEIFQDENAHWKEWLQHYAGEGKDLLDALLDVFTYADLRPEVKDEMWGALGLNVTIYLSASEALEPALVFPYYHKKIVKTQPISYRPRRIKLNTAQAEQIIEVSRMVLVKNFREIDPISFSTPQYINYYKLDRGITVALFGMRPERRHPIDSYMGYVAFKNGLPVAYAGSWVLFDSARIGLNVFPSYRGGESRYIFESVMYLHKEVYHLKRFSVDPYQIGKHNKDGIHSGAFWLYHHLGFRPLKPEQQMIAEAESLKISAEKGYRTPEGTLKKLAESRMALPLSGKPVNFDAVDLSRAYAVYVNKKFGGNRLAAEQKGLAALKKYLGLKTADDAALLFVMRNWSAVLMHDPSLLDGKLKAEIKQMLQLKVKGAEEAYMACLRNSPALRRLVEQFVRLYAS